MPPLPSHAVHGFDMGILHYARITLTNKNIQLCCIQFIKVRNSELIASLIFATVRKHAIYNSMLACAILGINCTSVHVVIIIKVAYYYYYPCGYLPYYYYY